MKVGVVTACDAAYNDLLSVVMPNRLDYCNRHGYTHILRGWNGDDRGPQWARIGAAISVLDEFDLMFIMDVDAIITNMDVKLEELSIFYPSLTATEDVNGFNSGMLMLQNSPWTEYFMKRYWKIGPLYNHYANPEQSCLAHLLICEPPAVWDVVPQREFNSYLYEHYDYGDYPLGQWQEGDFVLHLPGMDNAKRIEILNEKLSSHR